MGCNNVISSTVLELDHIFPYLWKYHCQNTVIPLIARFMGPNWGQQDPGGPHVGPMNFVIRVSRKSNWWISSIVGDCYNNTVQYNTISVLKIRSTCHSRDLWKLARSCKQLCLLCPPHVIFIRPCLTLWISKHPGSYEIHWVRQYLINVFLFQIEDLLTSEMTVKLESNWYFKPVNIYLYL